MRLPRCVPPAWLRVLRLAATGAALFVSACSDPPNNPGPITPPPPPPPPVVNELPVIESIAVSAQRVEIGTEVTLTARVRDAETATDQLKLEWTAEGGTFNGQGTAVAWTPPSDGPTPRDYSVTLTVVETYGTSSANGMRPEHRVTATSPPIRVHNSVKELGDMGVSFLRKFGQSSVSPQECVADFSDTCRGKRDELSDIEHNRRHYAILSASVGAPRVSYAAGSNSAEVVIRASYTSRVINCQNWPWPGPCALNEVGSVTFDGRLSSVYHDGRWWLCESRAIAVLNGPIAPMMRHFFGGFREQ